MCLPLFPSPALQTQVLSTLQTAAPSTEAARSAFPIARGSCVNWSVNIQLTSSSPRTRGARSQRSPASQSARSPSGFRTEGSRKKRSSPRSRPALLCEGAPWLGRWVGGNGRYPRHTRSLPGTGWGPGLCCLASRGDTLFRSWLLCCSSGTA